MGFTCSIGSEKTTTKTKVWTEWFLRKQNKAAIAWGAPDPTTTTTTTANWDSCAAQSCPDGKKKVLVSEISVSYSYTTGPTTNISYKKIRAFHIYVKTESTSTTEVAEKVYKYDCVKEDEEEGGNGEGEGGSEEGEEGGNGEGNGEGGNEEEGSNGEGNGEEGGKGKKIF